MYCLTIFYEKNFRCKEIQSVLKVCAHYASENVDDSQIKKLKMDFDQDLNLEFDVSFIIYDYCIFITF